VRVAPARLEGSQVYLRRLELPDAPALLDLRVANKTFLEPFEPSRHDRFFTLQSQRDYIQMAIVDWDDDEAYAFGIFGPNDEMIGRVALSNVVRGAWQNATLGYFVAERHTGKGCATQAVGLAVAFAFEEARLHRVQAGVMLHNKASARVLVKNGFRYEGLSPRYLKINGRWEDHDMYAITAEDTGRSDPIP